jgi:hypothetical protein
MTWTDRISDLKSYKIQSHSEEGLTEDFTNLFAEISGDEFRDEPQILIYINATNGNLFISAFDSKTNVASLKVLQKNGFIKVNETETSFSWKLIIQ